MNIHRIESPKRHWVFCAMVFAIVAIIAGEVWGLPAFLHHAKAQSVPPITVSINIAGQTLSGTVSYSISTNLPCSSNPGAFPAILYDGLSSIGNQYGINTTQLLNGQHTLYIDETNLQNSLSPCDTAFGPVTFTTQNGHTAMQLRANYNELWLTPGQTMQLVPKILYTDNTTGPATSTTFSTASSSIVTVDGNGNVDAVAIGDTSITLTSGSFTDTVLVHVAAVNDTPQFGNDGSELTSYVPGKSIFVRSIFFSIDPDFSQYAPYFQASQVNTLEDGFYPLPDNGTTSADIAQWQTSMSQSVAALMPAISDGFNLILTGDNIARGSDAVYASAYGPSTAWNPNPLTYAFTQIANLGKVIGVEMVDEISSQFAVPFPQGQLGQPGGPTSVVCVSDSCNVNWPASAIIENGARVFLITGATSDPTINNTVNSLYTMGAFLPGSSFFNGFTFDAPGVGTHTFTPSSDPNLTLEMFAATPEGPNDTDYVANDAISKIMGYINAGPHPNITWPAAASAPPENFGAWAAAGASNYNDIYFTYLGQHYPLTSSLDDSLYAFNSYWNTRYPYIQAGKPTLFLTSDAGPYYTIQGTPTPVASFDGNTMTFTQPDDISNLILGTTRLTLSGSSDSALNGEYYVYNIVNPTTIQVYPMPPNGPAVQGGFITFADGQTLALVGPSDGGIHTAAGSPAKSALAMDGGEECLNNDNFGAVATVSSSSYAAYNGQWYILPVAGPYADSYNAGSNNQTCGWVIHMTPLTTGQSSTGGSASLVTDNYLHPGLSPIVSGGGTPDAIANNIMYAAEKGAAGVRVFFFGGDADLPNAPGNTYFGPSDGDLEVSGNPIYGGPDSVDIWQGLSGAFNLIHDIEPYLLQPKLNSPDYGPHMITGTRTSSYGKLLMMTNYSEQPSLSVPIDLSEYNPSGGQGTMYILQSNGPDNFATYSLTGETLSQQSISGTSTTVNFTPAETVVFTFPEANQTGGGGGSGGDTTPPSVPSGLASSGVTTSSVMLSWTASTDNVGVTGYKIYRNATQIGSASGTSYTDTGLTAATSYSYTVSAYDAAGNNSAQSSAMNVTTASAPDITPPTASITAPTGGTTISGSSVAVTISASDNVGVTRVELYVDGVLQGTDTVAPYAFTLNSTALSNGSHTLSAKAYDAAGNIGTSPTVSLTVSNVIKPVITSSLAASATAGSSFSYQIAASNIPTSFSASGLPAGLSVSASTGVISGTPTAGGTISVTISASNSAGTGSATLVLTIAGAPDTTPPTTSITSPAVGATISGDASPVTATASDNVGVTKVQLYVDGVLYATDTTAPYTFSVDTGGLANGSHTLQTKAYDAAGNIGPSAVITVTVFNAPQTLSATLSASISSGTAPLAINLTASAQGTAQGTVNYIFYCNRADTGTNITSPADLTVNAASATTYLATNVCTYQTPGTYTAKVIVEQGSAPPAQSQTTITVSSPATQPPPAPGFSITNAVVSNITENSAQIAITVSAPASVIVRYGPTTAYGFATIASPNLSSIFENLTGLNDGTAYDFLVTAIPEGTTTAINSQNFVFTTSLPPPVVSSGGGGESTGGGSSGGVGISSGGNPPPVIVQPVVPPAPTSTIPDIFVSNISFGDSGPEVVLLKTVLLNLGFFNVTTTITNYFGSEAQHAVVLFQNAHQLNKSGFVDVQTQLLLDKVVNGDPALADGLWVPAGAASTTKAAATSSKPTAPGQTLTKNLSPGSSGAEVSLLQQWLYLDGDYSADLITGYYGSLTEAAVKVFQAKYGIISYGSPATTGYGAVGPKTRAKLNSLDL